MLKMLEKYREILVKLLIISVWIMSLMGVVSTTGLMTINPIWGCIFILTTVDIVERFI